MDADLAPKPGSHEVDVFFLVLLTLERDIHCRFFCQTHPPGVTGELRSEKFISLCDAVFLMDPTRNVPVGTEFDMPGQGVGIHTLVAGERDGDCSRLLIRDAQGNVPLGVRVRIEDRDDTNGDNEDCDEGKQRTDAVHGGPDQALAALDSSSSINSRTAGLRYTSSTPTSAMACATTEALRAGASFLFTTMRRSSLRIQYPPSKSPFSNLIPMPEREASSSSSLSNCSGDMIRMYPVKSADTSKGWNNGMMEWKREKAGSRNAGRQAHLAE